MVKAFEHALAKARERQAPAGLEFLTGTDTGGQAVTGRDATPPRRPTEAPGGVPEGVEVEVDAVVCGVAMKVRLRGVSPAEVAGLLRGWDPQAKWRSELFTKGGAGKREVRTGTPVLIRATRGPGFTGVELLCHGPEGQEVEVRVSKDRTPGFADALAALAKVPPAEVEKVRKVLAGPEGGSTFVAVLPDWCFGVRYVTFDSGKSFLEDLVPEAAGNGNG